jgi:hypothetical protein
MIDTGGNTRYVPSSAHPARNAGQPDEPVGHEPDPEGGDREGQRRGPAQFGGGRHTGDGHRERGRHDADRDRRRLREAELTVQSRPGYRLG